MQNECMTSVTTWNEKQLADYGSKAHIIAAMYVGSNTGCLDYVTDEINISGLYTLMSFEETLTVTVPTAPVATDAHDQTPALSTIGNRNNNGAGAVLEPKNDTANSVYVPDATAPLDTSAITGSAAGTDMYSWNFGVPKQIVDVQAANTGSGATA